MDWKKFFNYGNKPKSMETVAKKIQKEVMNKGLLKIPTIHYDNWMKKISKIFKG